MNARQSWLDEDQQTPIIDQQVQRLSSYVEALADGHVDDKEINTQEQRVAALMKEIEPKLDDALHARITELLCELSAYNMMQMIYTMQEARPATRFRG